MPEIIPQSKIDNDNQPSYSNNIQQSELHEIPISESFTNIGRIKSKPKGVKLIGEQFVAYFLPHEVMPHQYPADESIEIGTFGNCIDAFIAHDLVLLAFIRYANQKDLQDDFFNFPDLIIGARVPACFTNIIAKHFNKYDDFSVFSNKSDSFEIDEICFADGTCALIELRKKGISQILNAKLLDEIKMVVNDNLIVMPKVKDERDNKYYENKKSLDAFAELQQKYTLSQERVAHLEKSVESLKRQFQQVTSHNYAQIEDLENKIQQIVYECNALVRAKDQEVLMLSEEIKKHGDIVKHKDSMIASLVSEYNNCCNNQQGFIEQLISDIKEKELANNNLYKQQQSQNHLHQQQIKQLEGRLQQKDEVVLEFQHEKNMKQYIEQQQKIELDMLRLALEQKDDIIANLKDIQSANSITMQVKIAKLEQALQNKNNIVKTQNQYVMQQEQNNKRMRKNVEDNFQEDKSFVQQAPVDALQTTNNAQQIYLQINNIDPKVYKPSHKF